jgi:hypothetical protein
MWSFSLILVIPLLIGVASTSKRLYQFLLDRGVSKNNALTVSFVGVIMLAGVMSSPMFLGAMPVRLLAGASYLYFLYVGAKSIIDFFIGGDAARKSARSTERSDDAPPTAAPEAEHHDCGCGGDKPANDAGSAERTSGDVSSGDSAPDSAPPAPRRPKRTPAEARAEIERRIREEEGKTGDEPK